MRASSILLLVSITVTVVFEPAAAQTTARARDRLNNRPTGSEGIAVSLRALRESINTSEATHLFGATRLLGFLFAADELGPDCILVLEREERRPRLRLDDLAVAYANIVDAEGRPACTIDPRPDVLKQLTEIGQRIGRQQDEHAIQRHLREWERAGKAPQDVRVFNVPESGSHFARTMVDADYDLKSICNGAARVPGITSLTDLAARQVQTDIALTGTSSTSMDGQNRFWFNPGRVTYRTDGTLFLLGACEVTLLTEQEAITHEGERVGAGRENPLAKMFAEQLTNRFSDLSKHNPIYRELENLYRAVALMSLIVSEAEQAGVEGTVDAVLRAVEIPRVPLPKSLPGKVSVKKLQGRVKAGAYVLWLPSCGGVSIDIDSRSMAREKARAGDLARLAKHIADRRPSTRSVFWMIAL